MTGMPELSQASGMLAPCATTMVTPATSGSLPVTGAGACAEPDSTETLIDCPACRGTFLAPAFVLGGLITCGCGAEIAATTTTT